MDSVVLTLSPESLSEIKKKSYQIWPEMRSCVKTCDAELQTEDGGTFPVHRSVMSVCSQYFKALFTSRINAHQRNKFTVPGVSAGMMSLIVHYAYTGNTEATEENVTSLLPAADQFNVIGMIQHCTDFLLQRIKCENCIGFRQFAQCFFAFELENSTNRFLMSNFVEVVEKSEEFLELSPTEVVSLLNSDRINIRNEEIVWEAGIKWIDYRPLERRNYIDSIMKCVRLGLLDTQYFMEKVKVHRYVENNDACKGIVIDTLRFLWDLEMISQKKDAVETPFLATPRIPHAILFTVGGWSGGSPTNLMETYDTKADRWIKVDQADPSGPRAYHKLAVVGYDIYVIGGFDGNDYFNSCRRFNAVSKIWSEVAPMHSKRCYVSVATLDNLIYAMGGYNGHHRQNTVEKYDRTANQWTFIPPMNVQRSDASAASLNSRIYIVGGFNGSECLATGEYYNPQTEQWTLLPSMSERRSGVSIIGYHGCIYALGGFNGRSRLVNGEKYNPTSDEWCAIPDMFSPRSNFAIEVMDDMVFVIGGFNGVTTIFHVECYDDRSNEWYEATDMNAFRSALAACVIPGLPNVDDYIHQNRSGLLEEKRQKLIQQQAIEEARTRYNALLEDGESMEVDNAE